MSPGYVAVIVARSGYKFSVPRDVLSLIAKYVSLDGVRIKWRRSHDEPAPSCVFFQVKPRVSVKKCNYTYNQTDGTNTMLDETYSI